MDEDPYYSGLEARITSKQMLDRDGANTKSKGMNWMRKVLSSNYINILTSKRHRKSQKKGNKSPNESDSDPYMSINEVYEPIYGYTSPRMVYSNHNPFWASMGRRHRP